MKRKSLPILAITVFLVTAFVNMGSVFAFDGKVLFKEVSTEHVTSGWISIFGNKTHELHMRTDGISHINAIALETGNPNIATRDVIEETTMDLKTSQNRLIGTMSVGGPENTIAFSRTIGSMKLMGIEMRISSFSLIKTLNGEIQWIKAWVFVDHEKIPVPPPPIPTP